MPTRPLSHSERQRARSPRRAWQEYDATTIRQDPALVRAQKIRHHRRWRTVRGMQLARQPLCEDPYGQHGAQTVTATEVDHRQPLRTHPHLAWTLDNLASLCRKCHAKKSQAERRVAALTKG